MNTRLPSDEPDPLDLTGRLILISGAAGALGGVIVATLLKHNASVVALDIVDDRPPLATRHGSGTGDYLYLRGDTSDPDSVIEALDRIESQFGRPADSVCCHAGMVLTHSIDTFPLDEFDALVRLNLRRSWVLASESSRRWIKEGLKGHLIFTTSWVQDVPWPGIAPYNSTKAAVRSLMRGFARELAASGIRSNAIAPGIVSAGLAQRQWDEDAEYRARALRAIPLGFQQPPQSIADSFLFLLSPLAAYMTGSTLLVDGGCSLYPMDP